MLFSSTFFLLYFLPVFLTLYILIPAKFKNAVLIVFSVLFYCWGGPTLILILFLSALVNYIIAKKLSISPNDSTRKYLLLLAIALNLGSLVYYKYTNFFIDNVNSLLAVFGAKPLKALEIIMPLGISFFTFANLSYVLDVLRKVCKPAGNFGQYFLYVIMLPKLIAGPIIRFREISGQLSDRKANNTIDDKLIGLYRFAIGLSKKVLIAGQMGIQADLIFKDISVINTPVAWLGIIAYSLQIYFDFSGYSDMAIGLARIMGFKFSENFDNPYISKSITEFWRRWHISLSFWLRDYIFTPLAFAFSRKFVKPAYLKIKTDLWIFCFAIGITFLISGLWHGAAWNFVLWGLYHGVFLMMERGFLLNVYKKIPTALRTLITYLVLLIGWVFFKTASLSDSFSYLKKMFSFNFKTVEIDMPRIFYSFLILSLIFVFFAWFKKGQNLQQAVYFKEYSNSKHIVMSVLTIVLLIISIGSIASFGFNPFIYFQF